MSEHITSDGVFNIYDFVDKYVERVSRVIDEMALEKLERELAEYGYVKVVRCRDCKNFEPYGEPSDVYPDRYWCDKLTVYMPTDGFCSFGKRKEGGE